MSDILVETYEEREVTENGEIATDEESLKLIDTLGLTGQKSLSSKDKPSTLCPYRKMTRQEENVYGALCPQKTAIKEYSDGPIPLRVLQVISHANDLGFFEKLEIWHPTTRYSSDPVLVGIHQPPTRSWEKENYILARWGAELQPMEELAKLASGRIRESITSKVEIAESKIRQDKSVIDSEIRRFVNGERGSIDSNYYGIGS